ncbi:MAG TPA: AMP-binding protein [Casimicrobium sp.]|nr:AMP-binding protein [Casimicrobium sp.]
MSTQVDQFIHQHLPAASAMPQLIFERPELQFPEQLNAVVELLDRRVAAGQGARILLRDARDALTYAQVLDRVNQFGRVLIEDMQLVTGNRVLLRGGNSIAMAIAWLAVVKVGLIAVATMPMLRARELTDVIRKGRISHALCVDALTEELFLAQQQCPTLANITTLESLQRIAASKSTDCPAAQTTHDDLALMAFTSGTTGTPKAALHTHRDLMAACEAWPRHVLRATSDDIVVGSPPLAFTFGLGGLLLFPMWAGASVYFADAAYTPESMIDAINTVGATICYTAPSFYRRMAAVAEKRPMPTLKKCVSAGEGLPDATRQLWKQATGIEMIDGIGATEMFHIFISSAGSHVRQGAIGKVVPGYHAQVVDEAGVPVPPGIVGKLAVIGPTGCKYFDDERQQKYVRNGWNYPGDSFTMDADGYFFYQARDDDMIVTSGYNVAGPEVENCLALHPAVAECAVIGVADIERGMVVKAFVVLRSNFAASAETEQAIKDFVKANLAPYKYPRQVEFLAALPRTETGKLQRHRLRQIAQTAAQPATGNAS